MIHIMTFSPLTLSERGACNANIAVLQVSQVILSGSIFVSLAVFFRVFSIPSLRSAYELPVSRIPARACTWHMDRGPISNARLDRFMK